MTTQTSSFCSQPEAVLAFQFFFILPILGCIWFAITLWDWRPLSVIPILFITYLWFFEGIPWRGRSYGYCMMPGGSVDYAGEEDQCWACKHIQDQLDCKWGSAVDPVKFAHKDDWRKRGPCSECSRSGALTKQDRYKGPVRWADGEHL